MAAPLEWIELQLWREVYRCDPLRLEEIAERYGVRKMLEDVAMLNIAWENARLKRQR